MSFNFLSLFTNDALCDNNGKSYTVKDALGGKKVVLVYFSAHWCPPCRWFTPVLSAAVQAMKDNGDSVEGVFVSSDRDENSFKEYHGSMSFLALPFSERELKGTLAGKFGVNGIPKLMILDGDTGEPIVEDGRGTITKYGAFGFPFTKEALEEAEIKKGNLDPNMIFNVTYDNSGKAVFAHTYACLGNILGSVKFSYNLLARTPFVAQSDLDEMVRSVDQAFGAAGNGLMDLSGIRTTNATAFGKCKLPNV